MKMLKIVENAAAAAPAAPGSLEAFKAAVVAHRKPSAVQIAENTLRLAQDHRVSCDDRLRGAIWRRLDLGSPLQSSVNEEIAFLRAELDRADRACNSATQALAAERAKAAPALNAFLAPYDANAGRVILNALDQIAGAVAILRASEDVKLRNGVQPARRVLDPDWSYLREIARGASR